MSKSNYFNTVKEFSRFADEYEKYNIIQNKVARSVAKIATKVDCSSILDIGCGSGALYKLLGIDCTKVERYYALDLSQQMLRKHPQNNCVHKIVLDFNDKDFFIKLPREHIDLVVSSSALQWCNDLDYFFLSLSNITDNLVFSIFTSKTFSALHDFVNLSSPIPSLEKIIEASKAYHRPLYYSIQNYKIKFDNNYELFRYIKRSGVSGGVKRLSFKETKQLISNYPYNYLEFEIVIVSTEKIS